MAPGPRTAIVAALVGCSFAACKGGGSAASLEAGASGAPGASAVAAEAARDAAASGAGIASGDAAPPDDSLPPTSGDELTQRGRHLLESVASDDPDLAADIEFPRDGWLATRDVTDPGKDWVKHVDGPFRKSVHSFARRHESVRGAQFVSLELGHAIVQATPKRHGFKQALWAVHGSRLTYVVDGHTRVLSVREMTAWRGAWYVTRLR